MQRVSLQASPIHQKCVALTGQLSDHNIPAIGVSLVHGGHCVSGMLIAGWKAKRKVLEPGSMGCGLWYVIFTQTVIYLQKQLMPIMLLELIFRYCTVTRPA